MRKKFLDKVFKMMIEISTALFHRHKEQIEGVTKWNACSGLLSRMH